MMKTVARNMWRSEIHEKSASSWLLTRILYVCCILHLCFLVEPVVGLLIKPKIVAFYYKNLRLFDCYGYIC